VSAILAYQALHAVLLVIMGAYTLARSRCGLVSAVRRVTFDNTRLMWHYTAAQGVAAVVLLDLLPRVLGPH
jgi:cytochrome c oxidase subunit I+III